MGEPSSEPVASDVVAPRALEVSRTSLEYVQDTILISRGDGDLIDALIFTTALDANMVPVDRAPDLGVMYGGVDSSAPDELRRPVSMHAVAQSLGLPFETVRRRFLGLVEAGACVMTPGGIVVPREAVTSSAYKAIQRARYDRAGRLYRNLKALGVVESAACARQPSTEPLVRAGNRALSEYMLRACRGLAALTDEVLTAIVMIQLALENTRGMDGGALARWVGDPVGQARPVRIITLAEALPFSGETVRRHLIKLKARGFCHRSSSGFVAVAPVEAERRLAALAQGNVADLRRLFARLGALGVLAQWDAEHAGSLPDKAGA